MTPLPASVGDTLDLLGSADYVADRSLATAVHLALHLKRPLFLEGEAGVGKTEIAKVLATALKRRLIRLQCYEGLDVASAVYEWDYARQMIEIRLAEAGEEDRSEIENTIFSDRFLIKRPLLQALEPELGGPPVLLIDELDRTDEPFEAYLLELLSDFQVTIPEIGTIHAEHPPIVVITSNRTREIHDALKRRCFYYWVDYPNAERELEILKRKAPRASEKLSREVVEFVQKLRKMDLFKLPGIAESIDWAEALMQLDALELTPEAINDTLGVLLKYQDDIARIQGSEAAKTPRTGQGRDRRRAARWPLDDAGRPRRPHAQSERAAPCQSDAFRAHLAGGGAAGRAGQGARCRRRGRGGGHHRPPRLLLDIARGLGQPAPTSGCCSTRPFTSSGAIPSC